MPKKPPGALGFRFLRIGERFGLSVSSSRAWTRPPRRHAAEPSRRPCVGLQRRLLSTPWEFPARYRLLGSDRMLWMAKPLKPAERDDL